MPSTSGAAVGHGEDFEHEFEVARISSLELAEGFSGFSRGGPLSCAVPLWWRWVFGGDAGGGIAGGGPGRDGSAVALKNVGGQPLSGLRVG